jgi:uncharacterized protein
MLSCYAIKVIVYKAKIRMFTTSINRAIYCNNINKLNKFISQKKDLNLCDRFSLSPILVAASIGNVEIMKILLNENGDYKKKSIDGDNLLIKTIDSKKYQAVEYLVNAKLFNINEPDNFGTTPLILSCGYGLFDVTKLLIDNGADINYQAHYQGETALGSAIVHGGHIEIVKLLLEHNVNIDPVDKYGLTPLLQAVRKGHEEIVKLLVENNADLTHKDNEGRTALKWAEFKLHGNNIYDYLEQHNKK